MGVKWVAKNGMEKSWVECGGGGGGGTLVCVYVYSFFGGVALVIVKEMMVV